MARLNSFPGAAVSHAMVKVGIDVPTSPCQVGYISSYSISSDALFRTTATVTVQNFNKTTLMESPPAGSNINGIAWSSICWIDWQDIIGGGHIVIVVGPTPKADVCGTTADARLQCKFNAN